MANKLEKTFCEDDSMNLSIMNYSWYMTLLSNMIGILQKTSVELKPSHMFTLLISNQADEINMLVFIFPLDD